MPNIESGQRTLFPACAGVILLLRPDGKLLNLLGSYLIVKTLALRQVDPEKSFLYFGLLIYRHLISLFPAHTGVIL